MDYSLIEFKLRRFIYLGHTNSIYVHPKYQNKFWKDEKDSYELQGIKLIQKIIEKNKTEDINSIIPIILKIEKENKLQNYEYLMYILAVCVKFKKDACQKMITDAYAAVKTICTDGFKLLMFYVFCNTAAKILYKHGYIPKQSLGYGNGARKLFKKWYLDRNPLEAISSIIRLKKFRGFSHKHIMNTIHLSSNDPSHMIYILFIRFGISKMEERFGQTMQKVKDIKEIISLTEQRSIYNYIRLVHRIDVERDSNKITDLKWNVLGKDFHRLHPRMLQSTKVITSFVWHLPLTTLLENTYSFHRHGLFRNLWGNHGCMSFILRFKDRIAVQQSGIHPIDSYLEYLRYQRYGDVINGLKNKKNISNMFFATPELEPNVISAVVRKKENNQNNIFFVTSELETNEVNGLKSKKNISNMFFVTPKLEPNVDSAVKRKKENNQNNMFYVTPELEPKCSDNIEVGMKNAKKSKNAYKKLKKRKRFQKNDQFFMKPHPSPAAEIEKFLSFNLVDKTLKNLQPSHRRLLIAYDNRKSMESVTCQYMHVRFVKVLDAIVLIIQSIVSQEKLNKPMLCALFDPFHRFKFMHINYRFKFTARYIKNCLFKKLSKTRNHYRGGNRPLATINWARKHEKKFDVFLFLGTAEMDLKYIRKTKANYEAFSNSKIKIIICCLNGQHSERQNISRDGLLYIYGFDKNTARIINLFINDIF